MVASVKSSLISKQLGRTKRAQISLTLSAYVKGSSSTVLSDSMLREAPIKSSKGFFERARRTKGGGKAGEFITGFILLSALQGFGDQDSFLSSPLMKTSHCVSLSRMCQSPFKYKLRRLQS